MVRPNYLEYIGSGFYIDREGHIKHSAKGSEWKKHKYIKKENGVYYYPISYKGGRHLVNSFKQIDELHEKNKKESELLSKGDEKKIQEYENKLITEFFNAENEADKKMAEAKINSFSQKQEDANSELSQIKDVVKNAFDKVKDIVIGKEGKVTHYGMHTKK